MSLAKNVQGNCDVVIFIFTIVILQYVGGLELEPVQLDS